MRPFHISITPDLKFGSNCKQIRGFFILFIFILMFFSNRRAGLFSNLKNNYTYVADELSMNSSTAHVVSCYVLMAYVSNPTCMYLEKKNYICSLALNSRYDRLDPAVEKQCQGSSDKSIRAYMQGVWPCRKQSFHSTSVFIKKKFFFVEYYCQGSTIHRQNNRTCLSIVAISALHVMNWLSYPNIAWTPGWILGTDI